MSNSETPLAALRLLSATQKVHKDPGAPRVLRQGGGLSGPGVPWSRARTASRWAMYPAASLNVSTLDRRRSWGSVGMSCRSATSAAFTLVPRGRCCCEGCCWGMGRAAKWRPSLLECSGHSFGRLCWDSDLVGDPKGCDPVGPRTTLQQLGTPGYPRCPPSPQEEGSRRRTSW